MANELNGTDFFLSLLENSTDLISIIDAEGHYSFVGGSVKRLLGYTPDEMVGRSAFDYIHAEDSEVTVQALQGAVLKETALLPPFRFRAKDGEWRWMETSITNKSNDSHIRGFVTNSRDVTDLITEARRKETSQAHYESLFHNHPDAVFELDKGGFFVRVNKTVSKVLEYPEDEIIGAHFQKFVHPDNLVQAREAFGKTMAGASLYLELSVVRPSGQEGLLGITVFPVRIAGEVVNLQGIAKDITVQRKYDRFIQEQAEQLYSIMERIPQSYFSLDAAWRFRYVNAHYASYLGKEKEELLGQCIWELFPAVVGSHFHTECQKVAQLGLPSCFEETFGQLGDTTLSFQVYPTTNGVSVHFVDVTEQRREQDRLERLALVASKTTTCVLVVDRDLRVEWVNEAFEQLTGYTLQACRGMNPMDFLVGEETSAKTLGRLRKKLRKGLPFTGEVLNYAHGGRKFWFNLEVTPVVGDSGEVEKYISIRTDITERKSREQELVLVARDLFRQNWDLQQFSYMVSHNLRAPAANLIGLSNILHMLGKNSIMFDETLRRVRESAGVLDEVIRDMNQVLSIREEGFSPELEEVNLLELFEEVLASKQERLVGVSYKVLTNCRADLTLKSNKAYLREVLRQLLSNAIKFRRRDVALELGLSAVRKGKKLELEVRDNGIGMSMELVKGDMFRLYKKFHVGYEGRGVGLFLVKTYLDMLGGDVKVASTPEEGTAFKIKFRNYAEESVCN